MYYVMQILYMCGVPAGKSLDSCTAEKTKSRWGGGDGKKRIVCIRKHVSKTRQSIDEKAKSKRRVEDDGRGIAYECIIIIIRTGS